MEKLGFLTNGRAHIQSPTTRKEEGKLGRKKKEGRRKEGRQGKEGRKGTRK